MAKVKNTKPMRVQRKREKGWKMPENTVYVGRPSKWGNPFKVGKKPCGCRSVGECNHNLFRVETPQEAVECYEYHISEKLKSGINNGLGIDELRGKNLACWCSLDKPCHADILLKLANEE